MARELLPRAVAKKLLLLACLLILCGILAAGLSPFTPHLPNQVRWLERGPGLYFGDYATILSTAPLHVDGLPDGPCSIELWLQPGLIDDSNTMLAFQTPDTPLQFRMQQNGHDLILTRQSARWDRQSSKKFIYIHKVFAQDTPILITVTAGAEGTAVYLNGVLTRSSSDFGLARRDLNGGIVVGNSPIANDSFAGILRGIAIYNKQLTPDQAQHHYDDWTRSGQPRDFEETKAVAIYAFTEHSGKLIHSELPTGVDLRIPEYYLVLYPPFLQPFWQHWGWNWPFIKDGLVNVTGFMPLGFFFCAYLSLSRPLTRAVVLAIVFGCAISFIIEATQFYLPTRDSDSMDFINNSLGTILGALLYCPKFVQALVARFGIVPLETTSTDSTLGENLVEAAP